MGAALAYWHIQLNKKIGYGYIVQEVAMTFLLLNDYGMRDYFDKWMNSIVNQETNEVSYKTEYQKNIKVHQLIYPVEAKDSRIKTR